MAERAAAAVTGIGLASPIGTSVPQALVALRAGRSGIRHLDARYEELATRIAGTVEGFDPAAVLPPSESRSTDPYLLFALAAADAALADAGLVIGDDVDPLRAAVVISSGAGGLTTFEAQAVARSRRGHTAVSPYLLPGILPNMAAARVAIRHGIRGFSSAIATACSAGAHAVAEALRLVRHGEADVIVCGGADAPLHPTGVAAFANSRALSRRFDDPAGACRPFDRARDGFVLGEGAGVLVVERQDFAAARGAPSYADLAGWGVTTDAHHPTMPQPAGESAAECMRRALADAGTGADEVDYLNAHGTATKLGDVAEAAAVRTVFGDGGPAVSSTKPLTGHMLGASGAVEAAVAALAVATGTMPHTINLDDVDERCVLDHIRKAPRRGPVDVAVSNSFAFGGHNVALVFRTPTITAARNPDREEPR